MNASAPLQVKTRAVIFDLDGVLVWTIPMHWWAFRQTFEAEGKEFSFEDYMRLGLGASRDEVIRRVLGELPPRRLKVLMDLKEQHVKTYLEERGVQPVRGSLDFVRAARARNLKTAVASASRTAKLLLDTVGATSLFDAIVDRGAVERSKPHPDVFLEAARLVGVEPQDCLAVEDAAIGVEAARRAGMRVLALTTTHERRELAAADAVYRSYEEIPLERWLD